MGPFAVSQVNTITTTLLTGFSILVSALTATGTPTQAAIVEALVMRTEQPSNSTIRSKQPVET